MNRINNETILENVLLEGTKKFARGKSPSRTINGKLHGKDDFLSYYRYIYPSYQAPPHIKKICGKLADVERGRIKRLMINMPPRHGKSETASQAFPTWSLGRNPAKQMIISSYNASKAEDFTRWQRDTCKDVFFHDIFPDLKISATSQAKDQWGTTAGGQVIGAGVRGPITGRGADLVIIDDPIKDYEEAISETIQDSIWDWYRSTLYTRLHPDAAIIIIMTRWVTNDLSGRLIDEQGLVEDDGEWDLLKLPALSPAGEALWPERYSVDMLMQIRKNIGEKLFSSLYQQEPVDLIERLFGDPRFEEAPNDLKKIAYLDPAFGGSDYSAFTAGGLNRKDNEDDTIQITAGEIWKGQIDVTYDKTEKLCKALNVGTLYIESNQAQKALALEFRKRGIIVREVQNISNKHLRIVNAVKVNWDRIRFSRAVSAEYLKQVLNYSELARHDDAPDSLAGLVERLGQGGPSIERRYDFFKSLWR